MREAGLVYVDPLRLDKRPLHEIMDDEIPFDCPRWKQEMREHSVKLSAKGLLTW